MTHLRNVEAWAAVHVVLLAPPAGAAEGRSADGPPCPGEAVIPRDAPSRGPAADALLCLVNARGSGHGLRPVKRSRMLTHAASSHSRDMVRRRYFAHVSPSGVGLYRRVARTGYLRRAPRVDLGEALAFGAPMEGGSEGATLSLAFGRR